MGSKIKVWFEDQHIFVKLISGQQKNLPQSWFTRLREASDEDRENYIISPFGIHWKKIDEDLSFEGFSSYVKQSI